MLNRLFLLSGFDPALLASVSPRHRFWLSFTSVWNLASLLLCGVSAGFLFWFTTHSLSLACMALLVVSLLLLSLQALLISGTGESCILSEKESKLWQPNWLRSAMVLGFALVFAQPILFFEFSRNATYSGSGGQAAQSLRQQYQATALREQENRIRLQIANSREALERLRAAHPSAEVSKPQASQSDEPVILTGQSRRKALLIGNQRYSGSPLSNPVKDTRDLAAVLSKIGFEVKLLNDATRQQMELAIQNYQRTLQPGDISVFYFSGHGFQENGNNYLLATDAQDNAPRYAVSASTMVEVLSRRSLSANVVLVDACRSFVNRAQGGLASIEAGKNTYIALSAKPGQTSIDGATGSNGVFTQALLQHIAKPIDIDMVFREVRKDVSSLSGNRQDTWSTNNLTSSLILASAEYVTANSVGSISQALTTPVPDSIANANSPGLSACQARVSKLPSDQRQNGLELCENAHLIRLQEDLQAYQKDAESQMSVEEAVPQAGAMLTHYFYGARGVELLWQNFVLMLVIAGGFLLRERLTGLRDYEKLRYDMHRRQVQDAFEAMQNILTKLPLTPKGMIDRLSAPFPAPVNTGSKRGGTIDESQEAHRALFERMKQQREVAA
jgi:hypothetical protein